MPEKLELIRAPRTSHPPDQTLALEGTNAAPGLRHRKCYFLGKALEGGPGFTLPAGKLQQASKHQLLGRQQVRTPQNLRRDDRAVEELKWIEYLPGLESETRPSLLTRDTEPGIKRAISRLADLKTFRYTWGSDRVQAHGFTKTFLAEGTAQNGAFGRFEGSTGTVCQNLAKPVPVVRF